MQRYCVPADCGKLLLSVNSTATAHVYHGGARRDRTVDLLLAKQALSQLSYSPGIGDGGSGWI